jgi:hypothetical protein
LWYPIVPPFSCWDMFWNTLGIIQSSICRFWVCQCEFCYVCNWCESRLETDCHYRTFSDFLSVPRECCNLMFVHSPLSIPFHILSLIFIWTFSIVTTHIHHTVIWKLPVSETLCGFVCCDNGKSPNEYKLQYLCETIVRNIYDFPFHFIGVPNISLHNMYFISWYKIVNLQTTGLVFKF